MNCGHPTVTGLLCVTCRATADSAVAMNTGRGGLVPTVRDLYLMGESQRLADAVVDAAIDWHKSDMDESMDAAQTLEDAIEALLEFRRKMPIVKER